MYCSFIAFYVNFCYVRVTMQKLTLENPFGECYCPATKSEGGAFMKPPPVRVADTQQGLGYCVA